MANSSENEAYTDSSEVACEIPKWLTEEIFFDSLKNDVKNFERIVKFELVPAVSAGENYLTTLLRALIEVQLKDESIKNTSYIIKLLPSSEEMQSLVRSWKVFDKEAKVYQHYIPEFEKMYSNVGKTISFGPRFININNSNLPEHVIILEDLRLRRFKNVPRQNGFDMVHTKSVLEKLALFHAASACHYETKGPYPEIYMQCLCSKEDLFADHRKNVSSLFRECLSLYGTAHLKEKLILYQSQAPDLFQKVSIIDSNEFNVLNHGDAWSNNIMFNYDADGNVTETLLIDMQMSRYGPPAHDLLYLLLSSTCLEIKLKYFDYFVQFYHEKLIENLELLQYSKPLPRLKDLHVSLLRNGDWAYTIVTALLPILLFDKSEKANIDNVFNDNELKRAMFSNKRYVQHMQKILPWMESRGLLDYAEN